MKLSSLKRKRTIKRKHSVRRKRTVRRHHHHRHHMRGGMCPCMMMRGGDGVGPATSNSVLGTPVPTNKGVVTIPGQPPEDISEFKTFYQKLMDGDYATEKNDY